RPRAPAAAPTDPARCAGAAVARTGRRVRAVAAESARRRAPAEPRCCRDAGQKRRPPPVERNRSRPPGANSGWAARRLIAGLVALSPAEDNFDAAVFLAAVGVIGAVGL